MTTNDLLKELARIKQQSQADADNTLHRYQKGMLTLSGYHKTINNLVNTFHETCGDAVMDWEENSINTTGEDGDKLTKDEYKALMDSIESGPMSAELAMAIGKIHLFFQQ